MEPDEKEKLLLRKKETFGSNVGEGIGCFWFLIGLGILFNSSKIIDLIGKYMIGCR